MDDKGVTHILTTGWGRTCPGMNISRTEVSGLRSLAVLLELLRSLMRLFKVLEDHLGQYDGMGLASHFGECVKHTIV